MDGGGNDIGSWADSRGGDGKGDGSSPPRLCLLILIFFDSIARAEAVGEDQGFKLTAISFGSSLCNCEVVSKGGEGKALDLAPFLTSLTGAHGCAIEGQVAGGVDMVAAAVVGLRIQLAVWFFKAWASVAGMSGEGSRTGIVLDGVGYSVTEPMVFQGSGCGRGASAGLGTNDRASRSCRTSGGIVGIEAVVVWKRASVLVKKEEERKKEEEKGTEVTGERAKGASVLHTAGKAWRRRCGEEPRAKGEEQRSRVQQTIPGNNVQWAMWKWVAQAEGVGTRLDVETNKEKRSDRNSCQNASL